jgi:hypothetical protein
MKKIMFLLIIILSIVNVSALEINGVTDTFSGTNLIINNINGVDFDDSVISDYEYVIYKDGSIYKAKNGNTGIVDYASLDRYEVIGDAVEATEDGTILIKSIWLDYDYIKPLIKQNVTIINDYKGVKNYYSFFGHLSGTPDITDDRPVMRFFALSNTSKPIIEWRDQDNNKIAWIVAHEKLYEDGIYKTHQHISIETPKEDMSTVITRFLVTYGADTAEVKVVNADFYVQDSGLIFDNDEARNTKISRGGENNIKIITGGETRVEVKTDEIQLRRLVTAGTDAAYSLGSSSVRWNNVYAYSVDAKENLVIPIDRPTSPVAGSMYLDASYKLELYDGSVWRYADGTLV